MSIKQKLHTISELSYHTASEIIANKDSWTSFLNTAAQLYKYPFSDQLLIHAQRPDATACASIELWNTSMHRWVKRGSKGIALIEKEGNKPRLKYVFDIADTHDGRDKSHRPVLWELKKEHEPIIMDALIKGYGRFGNDLEAQICGIGKQLANEHFVDYKHDLQYHIKGTSMERFDESKIDEAFKEALSVSIAYTLMSRCGFDTKMYFVNEDFHSIQNFDTYDSVMTLGGAVSELSEQVLRQIERTIKHYELVNFQNQKNKEIEGSNEHDKLHAERRLSNPRPGIERTGRRGIPNWEIRNAAGNLLKEQQENTLRQASAIGKIIQPLTGDRRDGQQESRADDSGITREKSRAGQSNQSNEMGTAHEQPKGDSRGSSDGGTGVQLSLFPTEQAQIAEIENIRSDKFPVFSIPQLEIEFEEKTESETNEPELLQQYMQEEHQSEKPPSKHNFHITDENLGNGGAKTKYAYNIAAIRTLQAIESKDRQATKEEQEILSRYVGWGGIPQAFDKDNGSWSKEYTELKSLLPDEEYSSARASTLNAHYTSPAVINAIYEAIRHMGFHAGNILEPACGIGNFFGLLPDSMERSKLYGVELDSITGRIAKHLYPNANITISGFEKTDFPDNFFDLAIGNVPFGNYKVVDKKYEKHHFLIHDYFFAKSLEKVRSCGVVAFVTSITFSK